MHPDISRIARTYIYRNLLEDGQIASQIDYGSVKPEPGAALVLCDTSGSNPIASRPRSGRGRFNECHILCTLAIIGQILASLPAAESRGADDFRIGVVTPYREQARRMQKLLKERKWDDRVRAGTIHSFQGLQFEAVIFDTVESPPLPPVRNFTAGGWRSDAMRLVNVACTRPQHKLILVANLKYLRTQLTPDDILMQAVLEASRGAVIKASQLLIAQPLQQQTGRSTS